jgi:DNA-binding LytR/AlgR family response regulator
MKRIFLVEDEWIHAESIRISIEELGYEWLGYTQEGIDALQQIQRLQPDVVLLDINLHGALSGIPIANALKKNYPQLPFIFVTSHLENEIITQSIGTNPVAYLTKPVNMGDLKAALIKAQLANAEAGATEQEAELSISGDKQLLIRVGKNLKPLIKEDIFYVQTDAKNYVRIFTASGNYTVKQSLNAMEQILAWPQFMRVHKEYIINLRQVSDIHEGDQLVKINTTFIPVGKSYRKDFFERYKIL